MSTFKILNAETFYLFFVISSYLGTLFFLNKIFFSFGFFLF